MTPIAQQIRRAARLFRSDERGSVAVEAVIILPMLFWTYLALYATFHSYRTYAVNQKAAYTIADMISRETDPLDPAYIAGTQSLLRFLTNADSSAVGVRVTIVTYDGDARIYRPDWSQVAGGGLLAATDAEVRDWAGRLPKMPDQERVIVVETFFDYDPPFNTGLQNRNVHNFVFTRPRYAPQVLWSAPA